MSLFSGSKTRQTKDFQSIFRFHGIGKCSEASGTFILPAWMPSLRFRPVGPQGASLATGLPALAMTGSPPPAARLSSFENGPSRR
jgi:hypothetical protein